jgi:hypothetical protein
MDPPARDVEVEAARREHQHRSVPGPLRRTLEGEVEAEVAAAALSAVSAGSRPNPALSGRMAPTRADSSGEFWPSQHEGSHSGAVPML